MQWRPILKVYDNDDDGDHYDGNAGGDDDDYGDDADDDQGVVWVTRGCYNGYDNADYTNDDYDVDYGDDVYDDDDQGVVWVTRGSSAVDSCLSPVICKHLTHHYHWNYHHD